MAFPNRNYYGATEFRRAAGNPKARLRGQGVRVFRLGQAKPLIKPETLNHKP